MRTDGLCGSITCDAEYPPRVAFSLLTRMLEDFSSFKPDWITESRNEAVQWPQLEADIIKYQDPANADQIMKIQRSLDETRDVLHNTIGQSTFTTQVSPPVFECFAPCRVMYLPPLSHHMFLFLTTLHYTTSHHKTTSQIACCSAARSSRTWWSAPAS